VKTRSSRIVVMFTIALLFLLSFQLVPAHAGPPTARILSINYPKQAVPSYVVPVIVQAEYSLVSGVDVGIWDLESGIMIQSISIPLPSTGKAAFNFNLTAPSTEGDWHLVVVTRIFWQDGWYQDPIGGSEMFTVHVSDTVAVVLSSEGAGAGINVDGLQYHVGEGESYRLLLKPGFHTLEATPLIQTDPFERFVFVGWSDGINSNPRQAVFSTDAKIAPVYRTEYCLSVKSAIGNVTGEGWYESGSQATFAVVPPPASVSWFGLTTDLDRFGGWSGSSESPDPVASVIMNGPKTVEATWVHSGATPSLYLVSGLLYAGAFALAVRSLRRYIVQRRKRSSASPRPARHWMKLSLLVSIFILAAVIAPLVHAQLPEPQGRSIVQIGDASWYYWNQTKSDTCILWLGGGLAQEAGPGYNQYWVNPYQYESFGTTRFLQDLSKYYCVIALEKGSYKYVAPASDRTIYQEPYRLQSQIISQVHDWIRAQGYAHIFILGYSVGANVAAMEVAMQSPEEWTSPDGLILITPRLSRDQISSASRIRASLLIMYGGSIETPQYPVTGQEFFRGAPSEGWHGSYYLHKEFHVVERMGHEVWTVLATGTYDEQALRILINFVERSKALQFKAQETAGIISQAKNSSAQNTLPALTNLRARSRILPNDMLVIEIDLSYATQNATQVSVVALDTFSKQVENAVDLTLVGDGRRAISVISAPPFDSSEVSREIVLLQRVGADWRLMAGPYFTTTSIADTLKLTLETTVPNVPLVFDRTRVLLNKTIELETNPGAHIVQCQPVIYVTNLTRAVFTNWEDGSSTLIRHVNLSNDTTIVAFYRTQYFVNATSPYGQVQGSGWYDENSTSTVLLQPPMLHEPGVLFLYWAGDTTDSHPRTVLFVDSPKIIHATWEAIGRTEGFGSLNAFVTILPSASLFVILLILNLRRIKH
jgi:hypothetical protein